MDTSWHTARGKSIVSGPCVGCTVCSAWADGIIGVGVITNHKKESVHSVTEPSQAQGHLAHMSSLFCLSLLSAETATNKQLTNECMACLNQSPVEASLRYHPQSQSTGSPVDDRRLSSNAQNNGQYLSTSMGKERTDSTFIQGLMMMTLTDRYR